MRLRWAVAVLPLAASAARTSGGCFSNEYFQKGAWPLRSTAGDGEHLAQLPDDYSSSKAHPLVLWMHGWGGDNAEGAPFREAAAAQGVASVTLEGQRAEWRSCLHKSCGDAAGDDPWRRIAAMPRATIRGDESRRRRGCDVSDAAKISRNGPRLAELGRRSQATAARTGGAGTRWGP